MLRFARELKGLSKTDLAARLGCTVSAVAQFESGSIEVPDAARLAAISKELGVRQTALSSMKMRIPTLDSEACHFRALRSTAARERRQALHQGELILALVDHLEELGVEFPKECLSDFACDFGDVESCAVSLRRHWGLGLGPIPNLLALLESKGVTVLPLGELTEKVDAFSIWAGQRPCTFLGLNKAASRIRFDAAHELGHLVLHHDVLAGDGSLESEANEFAGAFLLPGETFSAECPRYWNLERFIELKKRWRVSIGAMVKRAQQLGLLSQFAVQKAFKELNYREIRRDEPAEPQAEFPVLLDRALELVSSETSIEDLSEFLGLNPVTLHTQLGKCVSESVLERLSANSKVQEVLIPIYFRRK
jgi:Zn-dependent peptidase ImmA (M78 family)/transcriptional regulator with XRE-family HTH domain